MKIIRLFLVAALLLMAVGCGKKDSKPKSSAKPAAANTQNKATDALFEEFFDGTSAVENEPHSKQKTSATNKANNNRNDSPRASRDVNFSPNGRYVVQITTVVSPDLASQTANRLEKQGYPAYVAKVENPTTGLIGTYYRVRIGGFDNVSEAKYFGDDVLRPLGYEYWVDNKSNDNVGISGSGLGNYQPQSTNHNTNHQNQTARSDFGVEPQPQQSSASGKQGSDNGWDNFQW